MTGDSSLPLSRVPDCRAASPLRWGIMGPGWIAERFTESVQVPLAESIRTMAVADAVRNQLGIFSPAKPLEAPDPGPPNQSSGAFAALMAALAACLLARTFFSDSGSTMSATERKALSWP
ncbi:hypothetical protein SAMN05660473_00437 [Arthrobacter sp. 49Tsu3.1M3]|nr:hypothetical protein SAMN05660473_00437 [Arthrobacter sp. 49Tsu3.1M3]